MKKSVLLGSVLVACAAFAVEPEVKYGSVTLKGTCTAAEAAAARAKFDAGKTKASWARISIEAGDDATVAALAAAFPECRTFSLNKVKVTTLAPLAKVQAKEIDVRYTTIDDLSPLGENATVEKVNLYGSTVKDFSPLAKCPKLKEINYYATKAEPAVYQTLGTLKQCKVFHGGLSKIQSLDWVKEVPQIEELEIFSEQIADYSPVATAKNLKHFRAWNMNGKKLGGVGLIPPVGDVAFLSGCQQLESLELPGSVFSNLAALAGLANLKKVDLSGAESDVDLSFLKGKEKLTMVLANRCKGKVEGLAALNGLPKLTNVNLGKSGISEADAKALEDSLKAVNPRAKVNI